MSNCIVFMKLVIDNLCMMNAVLVLVLLCNRFYVAVISLEVCCIINLTITVITL